MRPLKITMSAFGPFADEQSIDFNSYGNGIFLITGDTGAGKTTIFDALTFALYGSSSGGVRQTKMFRSDFANADSKTYVELEFTYKDKLYKIKRNPEYTRPAKRGGGETIQKPYAELTMPDNDVITGVSEVSKKIEEIMSINAVQFSHIAMIAQGKFEELIQAKTEDRSAIFRRIFDTKKYLDFQELLKKQASELKSNHTSLNQSIKQYTAGIVINDTHPFINNLNDLIQTEEILDIDKILSVLDRIIDEDKITDKSSKDAIATLQEEKTKLDNQIATINEINRQFDQLAINQSRLEDLQKDAANWDKKKSTLKSAETAAPIKQLEDNYLAKEKEQKQLHVNVSELITTVEKAKPELEALAQKTEQAKAEEPKRQELKNKIHLLEQSMPQYQQLFNLEKNKINNDEASRKANELFCILETNQKDLTLKIAKTKKYLQESNNIEAKVVQADQNLQNATKVREDEEKIAADLEIWQQKSAAYQNLLKLASAKATELQDKTKTYQKTYESFLNEQAGIIATNLIEDSPCPVCGSLNHPAPAQVSGDKVNKEAVDSAREKMELARQASKDTENDEIKAKTDLDNLEKTLLELSKSSSISQLKNEISNRIQVAQNTEKACSDQTAALKKELNIWQGKNKLLSDNEAELEAINNRLEVGKVKLQEIRETGQEIAGQINAITTALPYPTEAEAKAQYDKLSSQSKQFEDVANKVNSDYEQAKLKYDENYVRLNEKQNLLAQTIEQSQITKDKYASSINEAGFSDEAAYHDAWLAVGELNKLRQEITNYDQDLASIKTLVESQSKELANKTKADATDLIDKSTNLTNQIQEANESAKQTYNRLETNKNCRQNIAKNHQQYQDGLAQYAMINDLAKTANGLLAGKRRLTFERYIQAAYFGQIIDQANKRLAIMTDGQYQLLRAESGSGNAQMGLDMDILDHWTGKVRDVRTLSGGESFKASLALALGLSDIIQQYSGGVQLDAMFIDEGFGSLDSESLEKAINILHQLSGDNRQVGIISHVSELRDRLDKKLIVTKTQEGSHIRLEY